MGTVDVQVFTKGFVMRARMLCQLMALLLTAMALLLASSSTLAWKNKVMTAGVYSLFRQTHTSVIHVP
jgi:hypothetical protein